MAKALSSKILVTNRGALAKKYGTPGIKAIERAVATLVTADKRRGLTTRLLYLDTAVLGKARVRDTTDQAQYKAAIDAVARKHRPEYLVILGSHDVVPYQDLKNKLHVASDPESDPDRFTRSDLPYACEEPYNQQVARFLGPTRVVGRIPDITGAAKPAYLISLLTAAGKAQGAMRPGSAFALSAKIWEKSTTLSVRNVLGTAPTVLTSPTKGPTFEPKLLSARVHFVNCHGDLDDHTFSGEWPEHHYQTAADARKLAGVRAGTVAAFECCYGAQLYDPKGLKAMSIANAYLAKGAAGVVASTTIAYGPEDGNANADVICQLFIEQLLRGASLGRALLEARLAYVRQQSVVDPYDEKTLAQFVLLGDPSFHPFPVTAQRRGKTSSASMAVEHAARLQRRVRLMRSGAQLSRECSYTVPASGSGGAGAPLKNRALAAAKRRFKNLRVFKVHEPAEVRTTLGKATSGMPRARHVFVATRRRMASGSSPGTARYEAFLAYEVDKNIVQRRLVSR
jgi:GNAT superfamily N-acetyltransferase